jgi:hypothetical protein
VRTERFAIAEGASELAITIDVAASEPVATITLPNPAPRKDATQPAEGETPASVYAGATLLGLGGASLIAGVVTGSLAVVRTNEIDSICGSGDTCPKSRRAEVEPLVEDATAFGNASTGTLVAGGVLAATGLVLVLLRPGEEPREARSEVRLEPSFGGLALSGGF